MQMVSTPGNRGVDGASCRPQAVVNDFLAELKVISAGVTHYPRGNMAKAAVDRRARTLPSEYRGKLAALDQEYHGTEYGCRDV